MISNSKLLLILSALLAIFLLGVLGFGVWSVRDKSQEASELLLEAEHIAEVEVLMQFVDKVQEDAVVELATFNGLTLSSDKLVPLIESIEEVGQGLGLDVKIVSVDRVEDKKKPEIIPTFRIATEGTGSWNANYAYLKAIESLPARVMLESVNIYKNEEEWQSRIVMSLHSFD